MRSAIRCITRALPRGALRRRLRRACRRLSCRSSTRRNGCQNMTAGRGWIALALVVFASWLPWRVLGRRLSLRRGQHPAAPCAGARPRHPVAVSVVSALSGDGRGSGDHLAQRSASAGRTRRPASGSLRAGPLDSSGRARRAARSCFDRRCRCNTGSNAMKKLLIAADGRGSGVLAATASAPRPPTS